MNAVDDLKRMAAATLPDSISYIGSGMNPLMIIGAIVNSALALVAIYVSGLLTGNRWATNLAIAAMGLTYLSYALQVNGKWARRYSGTVHVAVIASMIAGVLAGVALLFPT